MWGHVTGRLLSSEAIYPSATWSTTVLTLSVSSLRLGFSHRWASWLDGSGYVRQGILATMRCR